MAPIANNLSLPCTFTGTIQGVTEGKEPLYWIWLGDRWGWMGKGKCYIRGQIKN
jgi:hypothetical protein